MLGDTLISGMTFSKCAASLHSPAWHTTGRYSADTARSQHQAQGLISSMDDFIEGCDLWNEPQLWTTWAINHGALEAQSIPVVPGSLEDPISCSSNQATSQEALALQAAMADV